MCGGEHLAECGADRLLDGEGIGLACPETSELCCFIGEEYAVERALEQLQITAEKQSAQGDAPEAFTDTVIMYEVLSELKEIAARPRGITSPAAASATVCRCVRRRRPHLRGLRREAAHWRGDGRGP